MSKSRRVGYLLLTLTALFYTPYFALIISKGKIPEGFFSFPATDPTAKPGENYLVIIITSLLFLAFLLLMFFPRLFGFKRVPLPPVKQERARLPWWFWLGLVLWGGIIVLFAGKFSEPKWIMNWALLPLWWGFIFMLDGVVYARSGGKSLLRNGMAEMFAMGMLSISGWLIFEYFNFFIQLNWYYPNAKSMHHDEFLLYAIIGSSAFIPMAFEWYHLLRTIPAVNTRYRFGKKVKYSLVTRIILLIIAFVLLFSMVFAPNSLFYAFWLSPLTIIIIVLGMLEIWTPFQPIKERGDWTSLLVFAPVWILQGICVEWWNYLSYEHALESPTYNPGYWDYCIPYVNFAHVFNMPLLGYLGYVPFSLYCFIWVITMSFVMNISLPFTLGEEHQ